jgi:hypothetical protein
MVAVVRAPDGMLVEGMPVPADRDVKTVGLGASPTWASPAWTNLTAPTVRSPVPASGHAVGSPGRRSDALSARFVAAARARTSDSGRESAGKPRLTRRIHALVGGRA